MRDTFVKWVLSVMEGRVCLRRGKVAKDSGYSCKRALKWHCGEGPQDLNLGNKMTSEMYLTDLATRWHKSLIWRSHRRSRTCGM